MKREVKIGIFAVGTLLLLYWGINFLRGRDLFNRSSTYYATYDQVNGLQPSSPIFIKGFKVGVIRNMSYNPGRSSKIVLELEVKNKFKIPDNSNARIFSDGLMGGKAVEIELGNSPTYLRSGDTLRSVWDKDFLEVAGSEFEFVKVKANQLVNSIMKTLEDMDTILVENKGYLRTTMSNLAQMSGSLNEVVTSEADHLRGIIANLNALTVTLRKNTSRIDNVMGNLETFSGSLAEADIKAVAAEATASLDDLGQILAKIKAGEGTVGKFINDDRLYDSLAAASSNLSRVLEDLQEHPGRYVRFSVFGGRNK